MNEAGAANNETKIYVRDLKLDVTEEQLKEVFE
jgi:RNA recognition motif-containing protein